MLILTLTLCSVILIGLIGVIIVEALHPSIDTSSDIEALGELAAVMLGAVVGFIGGRAVGQNEQER